MIYCNVLLGAVFENLIRIPNANACVVTRVCTCRASLDVELGPELVEQIDGAAFGLPGTCKVSFRHGIWQTIRVYTYWWCLSPNQIEPAMFVIPFEVHQIPHGTSPCMHCQTSNQIMHGICRPARVHNVHMHMPCTYRLAFGTVAQKICHVQFECCFSDCVHLWRCGVVICPPSNVHYIYIY